MRIDISYDSCWRNSFLAGSNNEPLPKKGRKFIGSMAELKKEGNFKTQAITNDTVMGILNRLIGDQRKLYQSRSGDDYYFKKMEYSIRFEDKCYETNEITYLRNISGSTDQDSFTGAIKSNNIVFNSDYSIEFWGVLILNLDELLDFILNETFLVDKDIRLDPVSIANIAKDIEKIKSIDNTERFSEAVDKLNNIFPEAVTEKVPRPYIEKNGKIKPVRFYAASLYMQQKRLQNKFDMSSAISSRGTIKGFSKRGYNGTRDFMTAFTTGEAKKIWGNPYIRKERIKGEGEVVSMMTKASGTLEINIDVDRNKAKEIKRLIENAGVSSFYLGKKGLAYVTDIDTREVRH